MQERNLCMAGTECEKMAKKSLKVDREKFEGIVQNLLQSKPLKRSKVKVAKRKPQQIIPPPK